VRSRARLVVAVDGGRCVVRELRSQAPLSLLPWRGTAAGRSAAVIVHMVGSAATPLGGDDAELDAIVEAGASLVLTGVAAALALPAQDATGRPSRLAVRLQIGDGGSLQYLPEPTVVTRRADHVTSFDAVLGEAARLRCREVLVAGRIGEVAGRYRGSTRVLGPSGPLLVQTQDLDDSPAHLAGRRVLATEVLVWGADPAGAVAGDWWSLTPLVRGGCLATAVASDAVTAQRDLATAVAAHPGWSQAVLGETGRPTSQLPR